MSEINLAAYKAQIYQRRMTAQEEQFVVKGADAKLRTSRALQGRRWRDATIWALWAISAGLAARACRMAREDNTVD